MPIHQVGAQTYSASANLAGMAMTAAKIEQKAIGLLKAFENAGKSVSRVQIDGKKIELVLSKEREDDEFSGIDMRHDKT